MIVVLELSKAAMAASTSPIDHGLSRSYESNAINGADVQGAADTVHRTGLSSGAIGFGKLTLSDPFGRTWVDPV